jgi:glutamate-ammonia-ligase adenylyltransferase
MALTRARPVAGAERLCRRLEAAIAGVLERPRDPSRLLTDVADMRHRIAEQNRDPSPWDLKNRPGGLVDLEFIAQYLILREGGRDPRVLQRGTRAALEALASAGALAPKAARELVSALRLFRQTQTLLTVLLEAVPKSADLPAPLALTLARAAGVLDIARLDRDINAAAARVRSWYRRLIERPAAQEAQKKQTKAGSAG